MAEKSRLKGKELDELVEGWRQDDESQEKIEKKLRQYWGTPRYFYESLTNHFNFDVDVCAKSFNTLCTHYITEKDDALTCNWFDHSEEGLEIVPKGSRFHSAWCNPPYKDPLAWIRKATEEVQKTPHSTVVMILNHDSSTRWYSEALEVASEQIIMTGKRLEFVPPEGIESSSNSKAQTLFVFRGDILRSSCNTWHWDWYNQLSLPT